MIDKGTRSEQGQQWKVWKLWWDDRNIQTPDEGGLKIQDTARCKVHCRDRNSTIWHQGEVTSAQRKVMDGVPQIPSPQKSRPMKEGWSRYPPSFKWLITSLLPQMLGLEKEFRENIHTPVPNVCPTQPLPRTSGNLQEVIESKLFSVLSCVLFVVSRGSAPQLQWWEGGLTASGTAKHKNCLQIFSPGVNRSPSVGGCWQSSMTRFWRAQPSHGF